jgi:cystathionine beta-lyase/cystathionine gamma-synthase
MRNNGASIDTKLIHAGELVPRVHGAVSMPIFQSANYEYAGETDYHDLKYIRLNNTPNHQVLHDKLAALENAEAALVTASGMAAITSAIFSVASAGDHVLFQDCLYGGTMEFVSRHFVDHGLAFDFIDGEKPDTWEAKLRPETKAIYVESITNPLIQVADLEAVVAFARGHDLVTIIDNTFASPINFRPPEIGFDLSVHSGTKYLGGHSDIVCGAVIGRADLVKRVKRTLTLTGGALDPHACFLLHRGLKTLALRVRRQSDSALAIARTLEAHPKVKRVNYPGLESNSGYQRATELFDGFGGMLSVEIDGDREEAQRFMDALTIPIVAPSLGGVESLATIPATTSHLGLTREERLAAGISDSLIRLSVGVEGTEDLLEDFGQALDAV